MSSIILVLAAFLFLLGTFVLTALNSAYRKLHKRETIRIFHQMGKSFSYRPFHLYFFPLHEYEGLFFANTCAQNICRFCFAASAIFPVFFWTILQDPYSSWGWTIFSLLILLMIFFLVGDFLPRILGIRKPISVIKYCAPLASFFLFLSFPITYLFLKISESFARTIYFDYTQETGTPATQEILEIIREAKIENHLNQQDKKLLEAAMAFRERIAREVMVPRIDVFSLPAETTIQEAAKQLHKEGYSRIPVYRNSVDNIIGVLMYKDVLKKYREFEENQRNENILKAPIETIIKSVLYTPETKRISELLQEFRKKQVHLAIVVDEYGGTEGIVTIEDILEVIVGNIEDEYDQETALFVKTPEGWVVDARMSILDVEDELGIIIPQVGDYDTIGGYVFHKAGTIPSKGFVIQEEDFSIEILRSNDRKVEKVRIRVFPPQEKKIGKEQEENTDS